MPSTSGPWHCFIIYLLSHCTVFPLLILCLHYSLISLLIVLHVPLIMPFCCFYVSFTCSYFYWAVHTLDNKPLLWRSHLPSQHQLLQLCNICVHSSLSSVLLLTISFPESDFPSGKFLLILYDTSFLGKAFLNSTTEAKLYVPLFCFSVFIPVSWLLFVYVTLISIICSVFNFSFNVYFSLNLAFTYSFIHYKLTGT